MKKILLSLAIVGTFGTGVLVANSLTNQEKVKTEDTKKCDKKDKKACCKKKDKKASCDKKAEKKACCSKSKKKECTKKKAEEAK